MLLSSARLLQLTKERQHLAVRKKVRWCRAIPFQHFPKENVIFKTARISIPTTRVFWKYPCQTTSQSNDTNKTMDPHDISRTTGMRKEKSRFRLPE